MKDYIVHINKAFESRIRLGIMSVLMVNETVDFNTLKELLKVTDGNLASHIQALEKSNFLVVSKKFVGKKPQTNYQATDEGYRAFTEHLNALEKLIKKNKQ